MKNTHSVLGWLVLISFFVFSFFPLSLHAENYSVVPAGFQFTRNLGLGNQGQDVENLQCVLEMTQTTGYFGPITKAAVLAFQNAHAAEILTPSGLTTGTGYFGLATRNYMNVQLHNSTSTNPICPTYTATTPDVPQYIPPQTLPTQPTTPTTPPNTVQCPNGYSCVQTPTQNQNQQGLLPTTPSFGQNGGLSGGNVSGNNNTPCGTFANPCAQGQYPPGTVQASPPTQSGSVTTNVPPPPSSNAPVQDNFYAVNADPATLQQYRNGGDCAQHQDTPNCPGHPHYYTTHVSNPTRKCAIDPTIAYLEKDLLPKAFPGVSFSSDCRTAADNPPDTVHFGGVALDIQKNGGAIPKDFGDKLITWAQRPQNFILGLKQLIFYERQWVFEPYTDASGQHFHWVQKPFGCQGNGDSCHKVHVHFSVSG